MAEGGPGRNWNNWGSHNRTLGPRTFKSSTVCKFYAQGNCYYGEFCRETPTWLQSSLLCAAGRDFRHMDTNRRIIQEVLASRRSERYGYMTLSEHIALIERKAQQTADEFVTFPNFLSGASSISSREGLVLTPEFRPSVRDTREEPVSSPPKHSNEARNEASYSSSRKGGSTPFNQRTLMMCHSCNKTHSEPCRGEKRMQPVLVSDGASNSSSHNSRENSERLRNSVMVCNSCNETLLRPPKDGKGLEQITEECIKQQAKDREVSAAIQRSMEKACGICFELIMEKPVENQKFGILPNCNHCFCLVCIRKWRRASDFDSEITRACPECRVTSDFVCPSFYWAESKEAKEKLIKSYKEALSERECKYFASRRGRCPFGEKCFYKHTSTPGTQASARRPFRRRKKNMDVELAVSRLIYLWDFLVQDNDSDWSFEIEDLEQEGSIFSDSDDTLSSNSSD